MNANFQTLEEYLDALDAIKEQVVEQTQGMTAEQVQEYFAGAARELQEATGQKLRVRRVRRKGMTAKP
jgi:hypothetical protein